MARKTHEDSVYRVSEHRLGKYSYAATHPYTLDADGRRRYRVLHWGTLTADRKFIPGKQDFQATEDERSRLIFPVGWDLSALQSVSVAEPHRAGTPMIFPMRASRTAPSGCWSGLRRNSGSARTWNGPSTEIRRRWTAS